MTLFGTVDLFGLDMGFWVSMAVVALIVVVMNAVFWGMKPRKKATSEGKNCFYQSAIVNQTASASVQNEHPTQKYSRSRTQAFVRTRRRMS